MDLLKHETGFTFQEYLHYKRMDMAKSWLLGTNKTPAQISKELGFSSTAYFNRIFKELNGCTPEEFKPIHN